METDHGMVIRRWMKFSFVSSQVCTQLMPNQLYIHTAFMWDRMTVKKEDESILPPSITQCVGKGCGVVWLLLKSDLTIFVILVEIQDAD